MEDLEIERISEVGTLVIHFDVPNHTIELETLISISQATLNVLSSLNSDIFNDTLQYKILVLPPEEGGFQWRYVLCAAGLAMWAFIESDIGKGFIKGLTEHEPRYWAEKAGEILGKKKFWTTEPHKAHEDLDKHPDLSELKQLTSTFILRQVVTSFLSRNQDDISKSIPLSALSISYSARNEFYEACLLDPQIKGIGYTTEHDFPLTRKDFVDLIVPVSARDEAFNSGLWTSSVENLSVTSPNWSRQDRTRTWKGRDSHGKERTFRVDDDTFWAMVDSRNIEAGIIDNVTVQWIFQILKGRLRNHTVLRVLKYNGKTVSAPLTEADTQRICESLPSNNVDMNQLSFDI